MIGTAESPGASTLAAGAVLCLIPFYYGFFAARVNTRITARVVGRLPFLRHFPHIEATAIVRLGVAGILQVLFLSLLLLLLAQAGRYPFREVAPAGSIPVLLLYGVLLGIGEMGLSSFLCNLSMRATTALFPAHTPADLDGWFVLSKGGWMRSFLKTIKIAPAPLAIALIVLYVGVEETIFRPVLIEVMRPWGDGPALVVSTLLFSAVQASHMPSWRNALFPVVGAALMGLIHGWLYLAVPWVWPLIVAHLVLFLAAAL